MSNQPKGTLSAGFGLLWRRQSVLWWIFAVNFACGLLGTVPGFLRLKRALGHSLMGQPLTTRFDLGMLLELFRLPDVSLGRYTTNSFLFAFVFFVFMLFVTGGVLETYRQDRRLTGGEFFGASGAFFWRFVRLLLLSLVPFIFVTIIYQTLSKIANQVGDRSIADQVGIFLSWGAMAVFGLLALWVRLWFDIAQVRAVAQNERRMWGNAWRSLRIMWRDLGRLYGMYLVIALVAWITLILGVVIWARLPATATAIVFLLLQLMMFAQIATRLWQLSTAMSWYQQHEEMQPVSIPVPELVPIAVAPAAAALLEHEVVPSEPLPVEPATPEPPREVPEPARDPGPELPPADA